MLKNHIVLLMAVKEEGRRAAASAAEVHPRVLEVDVEVEVDLVEVEEELVPISASVCDTCGNSHVWLDYTKEFHTQNSDRRCHS